MPRFKLSLFQTFSVVSLIVTTVVATALALGIRQHLEDTEVQHAAEDAATHVRATLNHTLRLADLASPFDAARYSQMDTLIRRNVLIGQVVRVKIWNTEGLLLYSDARELVGRRFPVGKHLGQALSGKIAMEISSLEEEENVAERRLSNRLVEVYVPLQPVDSTRVAGAYEVRQDLGSLDPHIAAIGNFVFGSVGLSFLFLYGAQFALVRRASRQLVRRTEENARLFEEEQARRKELAALYDLSRALADAALDLGVILNFVCRHAVESVRVTFARVSLLEGDDFVVRAAYPRRISDRDPEVGHFEPAAAHQFCQNSLDQDMPVILRARDSEIGDGEARLSGLLGSAQTLCLGSVCVAHRPVGLLMLGETRREEREPFTPEKLSLVRSIGDQAASALHRLSLYTELERAYTQTVLALANAVDAKDTYTGGHAERLAAISVAVGGELGMDAHELEDLRYGAILHDIGKIGVPDAILQKPGKLTEDEWEGMRRHPVIGAEILAPVPRLAGAARIIRHHHERFDGKGYPDGLSGEAISLGARILTVVDSYSAITDKRVYKEARSHEEAVAELRKNWGTQFDPRAIEAFVRVIAARVLSAGG